MSAQEVDLEFTKHFIKRVRSRVGLNKSGARSWARKFAVEGKTSKNFRGQFRDYLMDVESDPKHPANKCVVRFPYIIIMHTGGGRPDRCITLYHVPGEHRHAAQNPRD